METHLANYSYQARDPQLGVDKMTQVVLGENEGIESALRRFKRQVSKAGILSEVRRRRHFETPLEKEKRKAVAKRRKRRFG
jgi:small subunit ribosomal protein S21